jgi:hypothetical protein
LAELGGSGTVSLCQFLHNVALGGNGATGGNGFGGAIYVGGGATLSASHSSITDNLAQGGQGSSDASDGQGIGGGVYSLWTFDSVLTTIKKNHASTSDDDIFSS